jgi:hypothetical protein
LAKWIVSGISVLLAFGFSFQLFQYLNGIKIYIPELIIPFVHFFNEPHEITEKTSSPTSEAILVSDQVKFHPDELSENIPRKIACKDHSLGKLKTKPTSKIFTWKDEKGVVSFGDKEPDSFDSEELSLAGTQVFDYFSLNIVGEGVPFEFKEKLSRAINKMFAVYGQLIDRQNLKKVLVNIKFISSKRGFERYKNVHAPNVKSTTGFYDNGTNEAVIYFGNYQRAFKTAIHESAHAINRGVIGSTNKWLNEGLAEYLETLTTNLSSAEIKPNSDWFKNGQLVSRPINMPKLLSAKYKDWNSSRSSRLYATSWAFIYFMMDDIDRRASLARLVKMEQSNMCNYLNKSAVLASLRINERQLQRQFYSWLNRADIFPHII